MKYLTMASDYTNSCIRDDFANEIDLKILNLPKDLLNSIISWNEEYKEIMLLDEIDRVKKTSRIEQLDKEGIRLTLGLTKFLKDVKIRYYSEGKLKYLLP